ncbi:MAG: methyltransferase domain-containing protein [Clostridia bacterium]|nr:methyltransferase domain-containing protein [Clostridia bacterium]
MYEKLAEYYDMFMDDVPYGAWVSYVRKFLPNAGRGRDVGCGTGKFTIPLSRYGYEITGSDVSEQMLALANENARREGASVLFIRQDATELCDTRPLDFITANCDVVNYLRRPVDFFTKAYKSLKKGGVLVFDISTEYKLKNVLGNNVFTQTEGDVTYVWENFYSAKSKKVDMRLTFFERLPNNYYTKSIDEQTQYAHSEKSIIEQLEKAGFTDIKAYGFLSENAPKDKEERIHFVAYKTGE